MVAPKVEKMGRFAVDIELVNNQDRVLAEAGFLDQAKIRRAIIRGVVDSGAARLVLPASVAATLGLKATAHAKVKYADGRIATRDIVEGIRLSYGGRSSTFNAIVEPDRDSALIGAIVMEDLDLIIDCTKQALVPRDPKQIISEIE